MTDPRGPVVFVVLLHEVCEGSWSSDLSSRSLRVAWLSGPGPGPSNSPRVGEELEPAVTVTADFPLRVQALAVAPDTVATLDTPTM